MDLSIIITHIDKEKLHSPASIVEEASQSGLINDSQTKHRVRLKLARKAQKLGKPDGYIEKRGQAPIPGWEAEKWEKD